MRLSESAKLEDRHLFMGVVMEAALPPEGLSDKNFLHGEFGENAALWRVRSSRFAHSPWYTVGRGFISHRYLRKLPALDNAHLQ